MSDVTQPKRRGVDWAVALLWATVAGSVALSIVSAYETFLGLTDFMPEGAIGAAMGGVFTFGVQIILFAISWSLANHIRDGFRANVWRIAVWIICAFFSGYFSFYGFFEGTGGRDENTRLAAVQTVQAEILADIERNLERKLETDHQERLVGARNYQAWRSSLSELIRAAQGAETLIEEKSAEERDRLTARKRELTEALSDLQIRRNEARLAVTTVENEFERRNSEFNTLAERVIELEKQVAEQEATVTGLQGQLETELTTGNGPRARQLRLDLNSAE
ncbi:MAG: hypothetical protein AAGL66_12740, partial [Pseudomonadota bacterium]